MDGIITLLIRNTVSGAYVTTFVADSVKVNEMKQFSTYNMIKET